MWCVLNASDSNHTLWLVKLLELLKNVKNHLRGCRTLDDLTGLRGSVLIHVIALEHLVQFRQANLEVSRTLGATNIILLRPLRTVRANGHFERVSENRKASARTEIGKRVCFSPFGFEEINFSRLWVTGT